MFREFRAEESFNDIRPFSPFALLDAALQTRWGGWLPLASASRPDHRDRAGNPVRPPRAPLRPAYGFPAFCVPALLVTDYISLLFFFAGVEHREKRDEAESMVAVRGMILKAVQRHLGFT